MATVFNTVLLVLGIVIAAAARQASSERDLVSTVVHPLVVSLWGFFFALIVIAFFQWPPGIPTGELIASSLYY